MILAATSDASSNPSQPLLRHPEALQDECSVSYTYGTGSGAGVVKNAEGSISLKDGQADLVEEIVLVVQTTAPIIASYGLQYGVTLTTIAVVGHLGKNELAAVALAITTANITGFAVYEGLNTALDTLCPQAYGAGRLDMVGIYLQRMICLLTLTTIPMGAIWMCSPQILAMILPEPEIAIMAGKFLRVSLIGAPGFGMFMAGRRFCLAQGDVQGPFLVTIIAVPSNIALNWLFVSRLELGYLGAALALSVTRFSLPLLLLIYVLLFQRSSLKCWPGLGTSVFQDWGSMVRLGVAGIVTVETEWIAFEVSTIGAAYLTPTHLAATCIVMSVCDILTHITLATGGSTAARLGNLVGAGDLSAAKVAAKAFCIFATSIGISNGLLVYIFRGPILRFFSNDQSVLDVASAIIPVISALLFFDSIAAAINGLVRGLGKQSVGACINLASHYIIGVPLGLGLCFGPAHLELAGLWIGITAGVATTCIVCGVFCRWYDWKKAVGQAQERR